MKDYKRSSHTVWYCKYHLVWTTKYRYQVLGGDVGIRCRELLREIAISKEMMISIPHHLLESRAVQYLREGARID